jgi:hypothetical protein
LLSRKWRMRQRYGTDKGKGKMMKDENRKEIIL